MEYREISAFCVDEAHCILMWGTLFRPSYYGLSSIANRYPDVPIIGCTATLPIKDTELIQKNMRSDCHWNTFRDTVDRPNIELNINIVADRKTAFQKALDVIKDIHEKYDLAESSIIIYSGSRKTANEYKSYLANLGSSYLNVGVYHSQINASDKKRTLELFLANKINVVVSTSAFGMGIDKANVRAVIHLAMPEALDEYDVDKMKSIETTGQIYRNLVDKYGEKKIKNYGTSMKILQRFEILHRGGNWIYLLNKDKDKIDVEEIDEASKNKLECVQAIGSFVRSKSCLRKILLEYFGECYVKKQSIVCCSNCTFV